MRKHQQRQLKALLKTIEQAQAMELYADSQDGAIAAGGFIESIKGEGTHTVTLLEEYCELLYKASIGEIKKKHLKKKLLDIENSVTRELKPDRLEVAFLSYNASMSDSIKSIYIAAKSDPQCDAYWIPIPFFQRNNDGTLGEMHYEGADCYDQSIECTDWQQYDIEVRHPDVIFTFAPYDEANYVTTVHPNFYCQRLRGLTDLLIYVPYFVAIDDVKENFCTVAGCIYAHKVILQSEKIRKTYVKVFKKIYGDRLGRTEDKFVALGSPKYDAVINTKREDCRLPNSWMELIGNRKVVLYNTSIEAMLSWDKKYLDKIRFVFSVFRHSEHAVLWWRPHPLNEATYKAMRPGFLSEYKQLVESYKLQGWGIYDDTPDLLPGLTWSDAYIGDWSSVVSVYQITGKPIMICDMDILTNEVEIKPASIWVYEGDTWFLARGLNAIFKISKETDELIYIDSFPNESITHSSYDSFLYQKPAVIEGVMYFPAYWANEIAVYSVKDMNFKEIQYKDKDSNTNRDFYGAVSYGVDVFFTPFLFPAIVRLNTSTGEITHYSEWLEPLNALIDGVEDSYFLSPFVENELIWLASCSGNAVLMFNMETCKSTVYEVGKKHFKYSGICCDGVNYWLSPRYSTPAVKWNPKNGVIKEFNEPCFIGASMQCSFNPVVYSCGYAWFLPFAANQAIKIDVRTDNVSIADDFDSQILRDKNEEISVKYIFEYALSNSIIVFNEQKKRLIEYNCVDGDINREIECRVSDTDKIEPIINKSLFMEEMKTVYDCFYYEASDVRLKGFISYLINKNGSDEEAVMRRRRTELLQRSNANSDGMAGKCIYDYANNLIFE